MYRLKFICLTMLMIMALLNTALAEAAPLPPVVSGPDVTNVQRPTWSWVSGGGGIGTFRYHEDTDNFTGSYTTTTSTFVTAQGDMPPGSYTLYVQEMDSNGGWSTSGSHTITIDIQAPNPPVVTGPTTTSNPRPTWSWTSGGGGNGMFRYHEDTDDFTGSYTTTTSTFVTAQGDMPPGSYTLYVQERDVAGNWSSSGSLTVIVTIDLVDTDGDGIADNSDTFPTDPAASVDSDGDGHPDAWNEGMSANDSTTGLELDAFPLNADEVADTDGDGIGDNSDAFPTDIAASVDSDGDSYPDAWNEGKSAADSTTALTLDVFPLDADEVSDTDGDGIGDNADLDDDNDGQPDARELSCGADPKDPVSFCIASLPWLMLLLEDE